MNTLDPKYIIEDTITAEIDGQPFEFAVKATVFGEVLEVRNLFLELPKAARRLIVGNDLEKTTDRLEAYKTLLRFKVPASIIGISDDKSLYQLLTNVAETKEALRIEALDSSQVNDTWMKCLIDAYSQRNGKAINKRLLENFGALLSLNQSTYIFFYYLGIDSLDIVKPTLVPLLKWFAGTEMEERLYLTISAYPCNEFRDFLTHHYLTAKDKTFLKTSENYIYALLPYKKDGEVYAIVWECMQNKLNYTSRDNYDAALKYLGSNPNKEVKALMYKTFEESTILSLSNALILAKTMGISYSQILKKIPISRKRRANIIELLRRNATKYKDNSMIPPLLEILEQEVSNSNFELIDTIYNITEIAGYHSDITVVYLKLLQDAEGVVTEKLLQTLLLSNDEATLHEIITLENNVNLDLSACQIIADAKEKLVELNNE